MNLLILLGYHGFHQLRQAKFGFVKLQVPGRKSRILQGRVKEVEQVLGAQAGSRNVVVLFFVELGFEQQIRHAQDAAEGCTDFVVKVRRGKCP